MHALKLLLTLFALIITGPLSAEEPQALFQRFCMDCHTGDSASANLDLTKYLHDGFRDGTLIFENLATSKMPPSDAVQPSEAARHEMLAWIANRQPETKPRAFRRVSRHEFVHSINDLLETELDLAAKLPEDRGASQFDSDRRIQLSPQMLRHYFSVAEEMLEHAMPTDGFVNERTWVTRKLKDSHPTYNIYVRDYREGVLLSWTRANNGNSYAFFYDNFEPPVAGWYELTVDAAKVGDFEEDISIQLHAGKYYYADDRPQPQRLLGVVSVGNRELKATTIRAYLHPGESVSVHCYSRHNFRDQNPTQGAYIRQLKARGPLQDGWPPNRFQTLFADQLLSVKSNGPKRGTLPDASQANSSRGIESGEEMALNEEQPKKKVWIESDRPEDLQSILHRFAERAYAAKLSVAEVEPYLQVALRVLERDNDLVEAAKAGFKAIICSHRFLLVPGQHDSEQRARKAALARVLWLSIPDTKLRDSQAPPREQIAWMMRDERTDRMIESLCNQWLNLRSWNTIAPSLKLYPRYDDLLDHYLPLETRAYLAHLLRENQPVSHLIDSNYSFLNQRLAQHYGIDGIVGQQLRKVSFSPDVPRGGLLTMGSILKVTTDGFDTSPILRGTWISRNLVGTPVSPPPETVKAIEPAHGDEATSLRARVEQHKNHETCYACHKRIDPYGFALESFDATGQWRTRYRREKPHRGTFQYRLDGYYRLGASVDSAGEIKDQAFSDVFGLKRILLSNERVIAYHFAKTFFEYANGYKPDLRQRLELHAMTGAKDYRMKDLVSDVLIYSLDGESR